MQQLLITYIRIIGLSALLALPSLHGQQDGKKQAPPPRTALLTIAKSTLWREADSDAFYFETKMAIDADGAPDCYHPEQGKGRDDLNNAGKPGNWWALVTDNGKPNGTPLLQGKDDPFPGYYIATTSLEDETKPVADPHRYVDASRIPFIVLPPKAQKAANAQLGDFAVVLNTHNHQWSYAIFADIGPDHKIGEGSIALAEALGVPSDARTGGIKNGIVYLVFPQSGNGKPRTNDEIKQEAAKLFQKWGGLERLSQLTF